MESVGEGRSTQRRMNRFEYENALRDLLGVPMAQVAAQLPEDGEAHLVLSAALVRCGALDYIRRSGTQHAQHPRVEVHTCRPRE